MTEGRTRADWGRTSSLMALIANCHRDPKRRPRPFTADDFTPGKRRRGQRVSVARLTDDILRAAKSRGITSPSPQPPHPPSP